MSNKEKVIKNIDIIIYVAVICYLLDIIIFGGGDLTRFFGISSKMISFAVAVLLSGVMIVLDIKKYIKNKSLLLVAGFMIIVVINAARGILVSDNISMFILISDVKGFLNFLMVIPMVYILNSKERVIRLAKICTVVLTVLAGIVILLCFYRKFPESVQHMLYEFLSENTICGIAGLTRNTVRVFFHTASRLFFCGFLFALGFSIVEKKKTGWMISMVLQVVAIILSFTRSIYLGLFIAAAALAVIVYIFYKDEFEVFCKRVVVMCVAVVCVTVLISVVQEENVFAVAINRCILGITSETPSVDGTEIMEETEVTEENILGNLESEQANLTIRQIRTETALKNIAKSPVIGNGLGTVNDPNDELIEYFYLDLLSKVGIVGLIIFLLPFAFASYMIWKNMMVYGREQKIITLCMWSMVTYLLIISYFNPCMNTTTGLCMYSMLLGVVQPWKEK